MRNVTSAPTFVAIAYALPIGAWWAMQMPGLALEFSGNALQASDFALQTILVLQLLVVCLFAQHWAQSESETAPVILLTLIPAWPLLAMLGISTGTLLIALLLSQVAIFMVGMMLLAGSRAIAGIIQHQATLALCRYAIGIAAAALTWTFRMDLSRWIGV